MQGEAPQDIAQQRQQAETDQQQGLDDCRQFDITPGPASQIGRLEQRGKRRQAVDAKQNAQHDAEIAPVRQGVSRGKVPYTCHL